MIHINILRKSTALFTVAALAFLAVLPITPSSAATRKMPARKDLSGITIVIDPGHGGHDTGALGPSGLTESKTVLSISKYLRNDLKHAKAKVIMTRENNIFIPLKERANIANRVRADRFVSVHLNSADNPSASRTETYYQKPSAAKMATRVQRKVVNGLHSANGGALTANFAVIRHTNMPAILTESAFISNPRQEARLKTASYKRKIAKSIFEGIETDYGVRVKKPATKPKPVPAAPAVTPQPTQTKNPTADKPVETPPAVKDNQSKSLLSKAVESIFSNILPPVGTKPVAKQKNKAEVKPTVTPETKTQPVAKKPEAKKRAVQNNKPKLIVENTTSLPLINPVTKAGSATKIDTPILTPVLNKPVVIRNASEESIQPQVKLYNIEGKKVADVKPVLLKHKGLKIQPSNLVEGKSFTGSMQITAPKAQIETQTHQK